MKINNMPAISLTSPSTGNNSNDGVGAQVVPSVVHVFYTLATERLAPTKATSQLLLPWEIADYQSILSSDRARASMTLEGIGYLQIASFSTSAPQQIAAALRAFARRGVRSLLIDLRGNRGGALESALSCAELFLNAGAELGALRFFGGEESRFTSRHSERSELPITNAVDGGTASAAEIFAGILRANGRALILGGVTYGKGTAQRIELLEGTGELTRRSVGEYLLPSIGSFDHKGLEPDGALEDVGAFSLFVRGTEEKG